MLDFGCGPGSYAIAAAEKVGRSGKVYALDIHPRAAELVKSAAGKKGLTNIETITSDCATWLEAESIDLVLLYDIFHMLDDPEAVLAELHRVLKPDGRLSFSDHHMKEDEIIPGLTADGLFKLSKRGRRTYTFVKGR